MPISFSYVQNTCVTLAWAGIFCVYFYWGWVMKRQQILAGQICKSSRSQNKTTTRWDDFTGFYKSFKEQCQAFSNYFKQLKMKEYSLAPFMRPLLCWYQNQFLIILENLKYNTRKPNLTAHTLEGLYTITKWYVSLKCKDNLSNSEWQV